MNSDVKPQEKWISSKEILDRTGISRATLNNYIKVGILPRPLVQRPLEKAGGTKKIGYFPSQVIDRIEFVQRLKREGKSMGEITALLRFEDAAGATGGVEEQAETRKPIIAPEEKDERPAPSELMLSFEEISFPSYFLNYDFDLVWINREAELKLFKGVVKCSEGSARQNIFRLLFHWEFHRQVANWKDLVQLHMAHAKLVKPGKTWISRLYRGISEGEISVLEKTYDLVSPVQAQTFRESYVSLLSREGSSELFRVISLFAKNGILLIYAPERSPL